MWASPGEGEDVFASRLVGVDSVISRPLRPDGVRRTHESPGVGRTEWNGDREVTGLLLIPYREKSCGRATGA